MGRIFYEFLDDAPSSASAACKWKFICHCGADVANQHDLVWEGYMHLNTPAFLLKKTVNVEATSAQREETLSTGKYHLQDVACRVCGTALGWKYLYSEAVDQKYKENCSLLQQGALAKVSRVQEAEKQQAIWA